MRGRCHVFTGFFGSGKTEGLIAVSRALAQKGFQVGVITCETGEHLVDGTAFRTNGLTVEQAPTSATDARARFAAAAASLREGARADVILIEATSPNARFLAQTAMACGHAAIIDPFQAAHAFGIAADVESHAIWRARLMDEIRGSSTLFINKTDRLTEKQLATLLERIKSVVPNAIVIAGSFRTGRSIERLLAELDKPSGARDGMIETKPAQAYSALNARLELSSARYFDGNDAIEVLANRMSHAIGPAHLIHLKISVNATLDEPHLTFLDVVAPELKTEIRDPLPEPISHGDVILNVRTTTNPDRLTNALTEALNETVNAKAHLFGRIEAVEAFWL